jgi:hypothetical protein
MTRSARRIVTATMTATAKSGNGHQPSNLIVCLSISGCLGQTLLSGRDNNATIALEAMAGRDPHLLAVIHIPATAPAQGTDAGSERTTLAETYPACSSTTWDEAAEHSTMSSSGLTPA